MMFSVDSIEIRNRTAQIIVQRTKEAGGCFTDAKFCDDIRCECLCEASQQARAEYYEYDWNCKTAVSSMATGRHVESDRTHQI